MVWKPPKKIKQKGSTYILYAIASNVEIGRGKRDKAKKLFGSKNVLFKYFKSPTGGERWGIYVKLRKQPKRKKYGYKFEWWGTDGKSWKTFRFNSLKEAKKVRDDIAFIWEEPKSKIPIVRYVKRK